MKVRTYEFFKVGYKAKGETEYTFYNQPHLTMHDARTMAKRLVDAGERKSCIARFQIIETYE